jgi:hypothetical protein
MGAYQPIPLKYAETFGPVGSRWGDGHRPARPRHAALPVAQISSVTFAHDNATTYTVTIDGYAITLAAPAGADATEIAEAFIAAILADATASQIVHPYLYAAGVMRLRALEPGTAFTLTATESGGAGTGTEATETANSAGGSFNAGAPVFRAANGSDAGLVRLPTDDTDIFEGVVQFQHEDAELERAHSESLYKPGDQLPVDPDGGHVEVCADGCDVGDPVHVVKTTGAWRSSGLTGQVTRVTAAADPADSVTFVLTIFVPSTGQVFNVPYAADATSTNTEVRDGLGDYINAALTASFGFSAADVSTDAIDITGPAGIPFTVVANHADLTVANQSLTGSLPIKDARWEFAAAAGHKSVVRHFVP